MKPKKWTLLKRLGIKTRKQLKARIKELEDSKKPKEVLEREVAKDALKKWSK